MLRQKSWIDLANEHVNIADVLTELGVYVPSSVIDSKKIHCPFGFYHSDGGISKAMRVYFRSNTAYCFSCSKSYSPVSLFSAKNDCSYINAAFQLLENAGYAPKSLEERWAEVTCQTVVAPDRLALAEALKTYCSTLVEDWTTQQLDDTIATTLNKCLTLLQAVHTDADAQKWLDTTKMVMSRKLTYECRPAN